MVNITVKPGWKKGTRITFEGKGDERPGYQPADLIFLIDEKPHLFFEREDDNLVYKAEIPLAQALGGCAISVPLLEGERMSLSFDIVLYPGYVKIIKGQGMPTAKEIGKRAEKANRVATFKRINVTSPTTSKASTTTTWLGNISSTWISYPHHMLAQ
ncbi:uncharacterized protein LOC7473004 [Populus trichocarpa]|uniref:uncharacterized protein LOC7473004 n=1 Tax=Populus trichocarpa TaxID=3694 RepID=UPI00227982E3|nr:uncharacterized protein LOC7473004 [Populus trichocarpa]